MREVEITVSPMNEKIQSMSEIPGGSFSEYNRYSRRIRWLLQDGCIVEGDPI